MNARFLQTARVFLLILSLASCAIKRPAQDFKKFQDLEAQNATPVEERSDAQMEFPVTPGLTASPQENPSTKRPGITLVLGGAGVASYATVGLLKRLKTEGVKIDLIVASGWPAVFATGYGLLKSVHDLEWFAMRLEAADFKKACSVKGSEEVGEISKLMESFFKKSELQEARIPIVIVPGNTEREWSGAFDSGDWSTPLLRTLALPGLYRSFPEDPDAKIKSYSITAVPTSEAKKRGASPIFAVEMYADYLEHFKALKNEGKKPTIRGVYLASLRKAIREDLAAADRSFHITLKQAPLDYTQKRAAILAGSQLGGQIIQKLNN